MLEKTRVWYLKKWLSHDDFKFEKLNSQIFSKNFLADKNCNVSANFQDIDPIFFLDSHLSSP